VRSFQGKTLIHCSVLVPQPTCAGPGGQSALESGLAWFVPVERADRQPPV
jgi:hypothetical protein